jgi:hypothetical protein
VENKHSASVEDVSLLLFQFFEEESVAALDLKFPTPPPNCDELQLGHGFYQGGAVALRDGNFHESKPWRCFKISTLRLGSPQVPFRVMVSQLRLQANNILSPSTFKNFFSPLLNVFIGWSLELSGCRRVRRSTVVPMALELLFGHSRLARTFRGRLLSFDFLIFEVFLI